jgi:hypothetical protein
MSGSGFPSISEPDEIEDRCCRKVSEFEGWRTASYEMIDGYVNGSVLHWGSQDHYKPTLEFEGTFSDFM